MPRAQNCTLSSLPFWAWGEAASAHLRLTFLYLIYRNRKPVVARDISILNILILTDESNTKLVSNSLKPRVQHKQYTATTTLSAEADYFT